MLLCLWRGLALLVGMLNTLRSGLEVYNDNKNRDFEVEHYKQIRPNGRVLSLRNSTQRVQRVVSKSVVRPRVELFEAALALIAG